MFGTDANVEMTAMTAEPSAYYRRTYCENTEKEYQAENRSINKNELGDHFAVVIRTELEIQRLSEFRFQMQPRPALLLF